MIGFFGKKEKHIEEATPKPKVEIDHLLDVDQMVLDYVKASSTDYAIMLKGEWGAGKTYYWNHALTHDIEQIDSPVKIKEKVVKYKAIHVSLFGIENLNGLIMRTTRAKYLGTNNKWVDRIATVAEAGAKKIAKSYEIEGEDLEQLVSLFKDIDQKRFVFCFDDLERLKKELLLDVLGYINSMVENEGMKVVILCNENELLKKDGDGQYSSYKEKLVRFTFQMSADIKKVLPFLLKNREQSFVEFINANESFIVDFYKKGSCDNIRTLKFNIEVFQKLYGLLKSTELKGYDEQVLLHYLMLSMLYAIEYKNGVGNEKLSELLDLTSANAFAFDFDIHAFNRLAGIEEKEEEKKEPSYIETIKEKYFSMAPAKIGSSSAFLEYMQSGSFDKEQLSQDIDNTITILQDKELSEEQQLLATLNNVWLLDDEQLKETVNQVQEKARKGELSLDLYPAAFARINTLISNGFLSGPDTVELTRIFNMGIKRAKKRTVYSEKFETEYYTMIMNMDQPTQGIANAVLDIYRNLGADETIKAFQSSLGQLWSQQVDMKDYSSSRIALLKTLKPEAVYKSLLQADGAGKQRFVTFLQARVEYAYTAIPDEANFLTPFKSLCDNYVQTNCKSTIMKKYMSYILDLLNKYRYRFNIAYWKLKATAIVCPLDYNKHKKWKI